YVQRAHQEGYRGRAAYKLLEIQKRDHLIKPGMIVVDLGAAPGGWSQVVAKLLKGNGKIIAMDLLPIDPIDGVDFILGDFRDAEVIEQLKERIGDQKVDLVLSDIAPNMSGVSDVDQSRSMYLAELAFEFVKIVLKPHGCFLVKVFQGAEFEAFIKLLRSHFDRIVMRKPEASRNRSRELYVLASDLHS
ncbi:MAG: 23S rRNA methyltransferase, partial [Gammaproteobacteria bacterium]|nr:23S rRNA methyltransferase [Gammaproteobacteria bacterium]